MHSRTFFVVFALATAVAAAPVPNSSPSKIRGANPSKTTDIMQSVESIVGSPFENGNGDGDSNSAGNNDGDNASGNGANAGSGDGNSNDFGNSNGILSGNSGLSIRRRNAGSSESLGDWVSGLVGSPFGNGNSDGDGNTAGSGDDGNASGNGAGAGSSDGDGNTFGNGNDILSGNSGISTGKKVRRQVLPGDALDLIPDQTVDALQGDLTGLVADGPTDVGGALDGAITGDDTGDHYNGKRQVLTGIEDVIADDLVAYIPK